MRTLLIVSVLPLLAGVAHGQGLSPYERAKRAAAAGPLLAPRDVVPGATESRFRDTYVGPYGGRQTYATRQGGYGNADGSTVQYGTTFDSSRGPLGGGYVGRSDEVMVTSPSGNGYVYSSSSGGRAVGPRVPPWGGRRTTRSAYIAPYGATYRQRTDILRP